MNMANHGTIQSQLCLDKFDQKNIRLISSSGIETPESLAPRPRFHFDLGDACTSINTLEHGSSLYREELNGVQLGHFAGALTLLWFTPWNQIHNIISGLEDWSTANLNLSDYFLRYAKNLISTARIPAELLSVALLYIVRFRMNCAQPIVGAATSEARLLVVALMLADKFEDDISYTTSTWAKLGNMDLAELKKMEVEFLVGINFKLSVTKEELQTFSLFLKSKIHPVINKLAFSYS